MEQIDTHDITSSYRPVGTRKLSVLHVGKFYPPHKGGIETHLQDLCRGLSKSLQVEVLVANEDGSLVEEQVDGFRVTRVPTRMTLSSAPICPKMAAEIGRSDADIVHLHLPNPTAVLAYLASGYQGRLVVTYHSDTVRQRVLGTLFEPFLHQALRRSSAIIATSPHYRRTSPVLARYLDRCVVIPLGIPLERFEENDEETTYRLRGQFQNRLVLTVGRLVYYKGLEYLIEAMKGVNGTLVIVGSGPLRSKLEALARKLGVSGRVIFAGEVPDVVPYYHAADVFVLASVTRSEAFGLVQIEAMAAGKPVVNTKLDSGVPFVSLHGQSGITVPPADPGALAAAINQLLDDVDLRRSYGLAARERARAEFSLGAMASRTIALYEKVLFGTQEARAAGPEAD